MLIYMKTTSKILFLNPHCNPIIYQTTDGPRENCLAGQASVQVYPNIK